jgi:hypothetical protein
MNMQLILKDAYITWIYLDFYTIGSQFYFNSFNLHDKEMDEQSSFKYSK